MAAGRGESFFKAATAALFLLFAALTLNHAWYFTMDADEAFNAGIAKNWLAGYGYSSSLGVVFPFDAYISSGPAYTLVQAIPVYLWGNNSDIQKPFIAVVLLLLLANILRLLRANIASALRFFLLVFFCLSSYALLEFKFWHRPAGELLALLYFANGVLLLRNALFSRERITAAIAGFFLACTCLTKGQALLGVLGVFAALLFWRERTRVVLGLLAVFVIAFTVPVVLWQCYKAAAMTALSQADPVLYQYGLGKDWHFFSTHGSGLYMLWEIETWQDLLRRLSSTSRLAFSKFHSIFNLYGWMGNVYAALMPLTAVYWLYLGCRRERSLLLMSLPLAAFLLWAFLLNNSVYTHQLLLPVWLWVLLLAMWAARFPLLLGLLSAVNAGVLIEHGLKRGEDACLFGGDITCLYTKANPIRASFENALSYVQKTPLPAPLANCGWYFAHDIEFALPGVNNIQDCMHLFDAAVEFDRDAFITVNELPEYFREFRSTEDLIKIYVNKRKNLFGGNFVAPVRWKQPLEFTYIAGIYMMGDSLEQKRNVMSFLDHCRDTLYADQFYAIKHCRYEDLQAYVNEWGGLPIFTHKWEALYYEDFMYTTRVLRKNPLHMRPY
jgi:hypothetical protein